MSKKNMFAGTKTEGSQSTQTTDENWNMFKIVENSEGFEKLVPNETLCRGVDEWDQYEIVNGRAGNFEDGIV